MKLSQGGVSRLSHASLSRFGVSHRDEQIHGHVVGDSDVLQATLDAFSSSL